MLNLIALLAISPIQAEAPEISVKLNQATGVAGGPVRGTATITFAPGLHGYQNPPSQDYQIPVSVSVGEETFRPVKIKYPVGEEHKVGGENEASRTYSGTVSIPFVLKSPSKPGKHTISVKVRYQQCTDSMCFAPKTTTQAVEFTTKPAPKGWTIVSGAANWAKALSELK